MPISDVEKIVRHEPLENCYEIGKELGRGKFAIVKRCTEKKTGAQYAAKILKKRRRGKSVREDILMEIDIMRQGMDHNRIIKLYEVFETQSEFYIIIELALGGELFRVIAVDPLPEIKARDVVFQILEGVCHLHSLNIVHMDLKPENLLLYRKGSLEIKIVDFGLAVQLQEGQEMKSLVGTAEYVSPEILSFEPLSTYSDMWSIGALTYALLAGYSPFQGETHQETFLNVSTCDYDFEDEVFDVVSRDAKDFIEKLLVRAPHKRLTAEQCLQHPWVKAHVSSTTANNTSSLDGSMSSLDSALCMDSASSMEPSPVSSASSSFSPAPSATSRCGGSSTVTSTTTTTTATTCTTSEATSGKGSSSTSSEFSRPEDMKKVNEKLGQMSKLATEQIIAETAAKPRPEGSPTSTASSTSTLRGEDVCEPVLTSALESVPPAATPETTTTDGGKLEIGPSSKATTNIDAGSSREKRTISFERTQRDKTPEVASYKSTTLGRERREREKTPEVPSIRSATLGRERKEKERTPEVPSIRSATLGRERSPSRREEEEEKKTTSYERAPRERDSAVPRSVTPSLKSATLGRERAEERRTVSFERREKSAHLETPTSLGMAKSRSATLGRDPSPSRRNGEGEERRTVSFERRDRSPAPDKDVTSLDPKTIESIERFNRLKERSKARESESYVQPLASREKSPEPGTRRRSDGETLTPTQRRLNAKAVETGLPSSINEEKSPRSSSSPESSTTQTAPSPSPAAAAALNTSTNSSNLSPSVGRKISREERSASPAVVTPQKAELKTESDKTDSIPAKKEAGKNIDERLREAGEHKPEVAEGQASEETEQEKLERARKEREKAREERRKARKEEEKKKEEEAKRKREEAEKRMEEERKRMEQEREKAREVRRRERERKIAQRNNSSGSGSSESLIKSLDRNRWAWSVEARTSEATTQFNGVKPHPPSSESNNNNNDKEEAPETEKKDESSTVRKSPPQASSPQPTRKEERKISASEYFQFGIDFSRNSVKRRGSSENTSESPKTSSPPLRSKSPAKAEVMSTTPGKPPGTQNPPRSGSPVVIVSPPPTPDVTKQNHEVVPIRQRRERSPATEQKRFKANKRMTPVISSDALDAILRGEVEDVPGALHYATEPNPYHYSHLESCPEENESPTTSSPRAKSPSPLLKETKSAGSSSSSSGPQFLADRREGVLPSALKDPNRSISPEKRRVTLITGKTQSVDFDCLLSPPSDQSTSLTPSPSPDLSKSFDSSRVHGVQKPSGVSRLSVSGSYSSLSRSTPDLSDILGGGGRKGKDGRKSERSSNRRLGLGRSRMDSYVTSTEHSSSYYHSPTSPHVMKSGRHATVTSRLLSGGKGFLSKLNETKISRQNHKVSS